MAFGGGRTFIPQLVGQPLPPQTARDPGVVITTVCIVILDDLPETLDEFLLTYNGQGGRLICREP